MDFNMTSHMRHKYRMSLWKKKELPVFIFWWIMHNVVSHPLIGILPFKPFFQFHDYTSVKINKI